MVWDRSFDLLQCTVPFPPTQTGAGLRGMNISTDIITGPYFCHKTRVKVLFTFWGCVASVHVYWCFNRYMLPLASLKPPEMQNIASGVSTLSRGRISPPPPFLFLISSSMQLLHPNQVLIFHLQIWEWGAQGMCSPPPHVSVLHLSIHCCLVS